MSTDPTELAAVERQRYAEAVQRLDADGDLSPEARQRREREAREQMTDRLAQLREQDAAADDEALAKARRRLFAPGFALDASPADRQAVLASRRHADAEADALDGPKAARRAMDAAALRDDRTMALSILRKSIDEGWGAAVVDAFVSRWPDQERKLAELDEAMGRANDRRRAVRRALQFTAADRPRPAAS